MQGIFYINLHKKTTNSRHTSYFATRNTQKPSCIYYNFILVEKCSFLNCFTKTEAIFIEKRYFKI